MDERRAGTQRPGLFRTLLTDFDISLMLNAASAGYRFSYLLIQQDLIIPCLPVFSPLICSRKSPAIHD
jgi:hypothetical protein